MGITPLQIHLKNNDKTIKSMNDFFTDMYVNERDSKVDSITKTTAGRFTIRQSDLLP